MSPVFFFAHRKKYPFYHFPPFALFKGGENADNIILENTGHIIVVVINDRLGLKMESVEQHWLYLCIYPTLQVLYGPPVPVGRASGPDLRFRIWGWRTVDRPPASCL